MLANQAPASNGSPQGDSGYDSILAALMETARGRSFLHEYALRNRSADTATLLTAIGRIENLLTSRSLEPAEFPSAASIAPSETAGESVFETMPAGLLEIEGSLSADVAGIESSSIDVAEIEITSGAAAQGGAATMSEAEPIELKGLHVAAVEFLGPGLSDAAAAPVEPTSRTPAERDPFADIRALSDEEKIALFT